ncbi:MAG: PHP domain-containing protein [Chloroflexota bacterium]|nr:PHP domain-containing protein [Chloroflexota bacterium]
MTREPVVLGPDDAVDLHMHTFASDGRWSPEELAAYLLVNNFRLVALADHDTMYSVPEMARRTRGAGIHYIPAVEMTTRWEQRQVHLLVYGIDPEADSSAPFMAVLHKQQQQLRETSERMIELLDTHCRYIPSLHELPEIKLGLQLTPHRVFTAMIRNGHGNNLFQAHNIVRGLGEPVVVDVPHAETVQAAHDSGALAIVAHPGRDDGWGVLKDDDLDRMRSEIPIDGVEAHYRSYKDADTERYRAWAERNGLLVSSGSDSHWPNHPVNPTAHNARWVAPLLERLGYAVAPWEGPAWLPAPPPDPVPPTDGDTDAVNPGA